MKKNAMLLRKSINIYCKKIKWEIYKVKMTYLPLHKVFECAI